MQEDRLELKTRALVERISTLVADYENRIAELRVEYTITQGLLNDALERVRYLEGVDEQNALLEEDQS